MVLSQCPRLWITTPPQQGQVQLRPDQCHYLQRVRRLHPGDRVLLVIEGRLWQGRWQGGMGVCLEECLEVKAPALCPLHLGIGIPKQGMDDLLYTLTELGVAVITPLLTERTIPRPTPQRWQRWQRICEEAAEQSEQLQLPQVHPPTPLTLWLEQQQQPVWVGVTRQPAPHLTTLLHQQPRDPLRIVTGPEGGWSARELALLQQRGGIPFSLGAGILRAVTAPVVVASLVRAWWEVN
ncbi:MAG: RsmE family RNA methyltransferase [Thermostichales cyanobacterium SZTDM-1c_bins_54]